MAIVRDGHVRILPVHVANKIAAGEVVERPASVVKELIENAIDAGASNIKITIEQGGRKLIQVADDGSGMTREDALISLERQATSKIFDVDDIENIDTLGFRGEAIPSIASVSRFSITTRLHDQDEGTLIKVDAGNIVDVSVAGTPPGTIVEVKDLFCNVPVRKKFLKSAITEENHIKKIFTVHAIAHPGIGFSLIADGKEALHLSSASKLLDRVFDLFGQEIQDSWLKIESEHNDIRITGLIEKPNLSFVTRRDQYIFVNGRPASAPAIQFALREAYPSRQNDVKPAVIIFINLPPTSVDVNVHPAKREVRFRDNNSVKIAVIEAIKKAVTFGAGAGLSHDICDAQDIAPRLECKIETPPVICAEKTENSSSPLLLQPTHIPCLTPIPKPVAIEFALDGDSTETSPWKWFKYLAITDSGFVLLETDNGLVTLNPKAALERIVFEDLLNASSSCVSQSLLIPQTIKFSPPDFARIKSSLKEIVAMGFQIEEFGDNTIKVDAIPQSVDGASAASLLMTIADDLSEGGARRSEKWREELIARSIAKTFAGTIPQLTRDTANKLVEDLASTKTPYVSPRGKPTMIFTSNRELARKFNIA